MATRPLGVRARRAAWSRKGSTMSSRRLRLLLEGGGDGLDADRAAEVLVDDHFQVAAVEGGEAELVDALQAQRGVRHLRRDVPAPADLGVVAHPAQQAVGDAHGAAAALGEDAGAGVVDRDLHQLGGAADALHQLLFGVEVQFAHDPEALAQRWARSARPGVVAPTSVKGIRRER